MADTYLLDTHCLLWFQGNNNKLSERAVSIISNPRNKIFYSQVSLFEIVIKQKIGKLPQFASSIPDISNQAIKDNFSCIEITNNHIAAYQKIPLLPSHRDPFDRLLIATAYYEDMVIISVDENFKYYNSYVQ